MSVAEVAAVATESLGAPVSAERIEPADWASGPGSSLEPRVRDWLVAMFAYYDDYGLPCGSVALEAALGRPSTGIGAVLQRELT